MPQKLPEGVKVLSESEIQNRLYGEYRRCREDRSASEDAAGWAQSRAAVSAPAGCLPATKRRGSSRTDCEWTGVEILSGELNRLRSQLVTLREERDRLANRVVAHSGGQGRSVSNRLTRWTALGILLALVIYPAGAGLIHASPVGREPTPYTIQVAVYDVARSAEETAVYLKKLGYQAFLAKLTRMDGQPRYRVYVGSFVTKEEATLEWNRLLNDQRFKDFEDAFVRLY